LSVNKIGSDSDGRVSISTIDSWFAPWMQDCYYSAVRRAVVNYFTARTLLYTDVEPPPLGALVDEYRRSLADLRGFSFTTIGYHVQTVNRLIDQICPDPKRLASLAQRDVERFIESASANLCRASLQHTIGHLRSFLRFCADRGHTMRGLEIIDMPRVYRGELPPRALDWGLVGKLLRSIDRSTVEGRRDYAILYLMAHYGLRPSEVAAMTVEAIDWSRATLRVKQCKTRSTLVLPLSGEATRAIGNYLRNGRPDSPWPQVFLKVRCPSDPIKGATIGDIFAKRVRLSGLPINSSSSPYSLRHSFAMQMLRKGVGIKTIGDVLGHRSMESTCVYLRLHVEALRDVALPVPRSGLALNRRAS
jgi:site-specific recombinase XerD